MRTAARWLRTAGLVAAFCGGCSLGAQAQNPPQAQEPQEVDVIRTSTSLVTVPVSVMDRQGRFIPDLSQGQFHLYENGIEQEIAFFDNAEKPFTVALLLDTSDSAKFKLNEIQVAALAFVEQLRSEDRVIVAAFDKQVKILAEATSDRRVLREAIRRAQTGGGTGLYNAIDAIVNQRLSRIRGRKAMVLFTDGVDTSSLKATYQGTLRAAEELDALVYAIRYNTYDDVTNDATRGLSNGQTVFSNLRTPNGERLDLAYARADRYLRLMTGKSGGRFYYADTVKHLREVFTQIAKELREQYSLGYYPKNVGQGPDQRPIRVKVNVPGVVVRARKSYLYKPSSGNAGKQLMRTASLSGVATGRC
jgi:Ca-activated chloride channel family protein